MKTMKKALCMLFAVLLPALLSTPALSTEKAAEESGPFVMDGPKLIVSGLISSVDADQYESAADGLPAGEAQEASPDTGATANDCGVYRVFVCDTEGSPVRDVIVQLCDETSCSFQKTGADGMAVFRMEVQKVYDIHVGKVPEGYVSNDETYRTLETFSDVAILISKAE